MPGSAVRGLRIVAGDGGPRLGKHQQRFNTLVRRAQQIKQALKSWSTALPQIHRKIADHQRLEDEHRRLVGELVRVFDRHYPDRLLTKRERQQLRRVICEVARDLLNNGGDEDLKEVYNRHSQGDFDAEAAAHAAASARLMKHVLEHDLGLDFDGADIRTLADLEKAAAEQLGERERETARRAEARRSRRKKTPKQQASEAERARVGKTLQEIYRKLAIALHPDREQDPAERARKTLLMQQINVAYDANDLLQLLELQLQFEQVDQAQIDTLAEDRLAHFNTLLADQVRELQRELAATEEPWRQQLDLAPGAKLTPARVETRLHQDLRTLADDITHVRRDLEAFDDVRALKVFLRADRLRAERLDDHWPAAE